MGAYWNVVSLCFILRNNNYSRVFSLISCFRDYFFTVTSLFIGFFFISHTFNDGLIFNYSVKLRKDYRIVWIPITDLISFFYFLTVFNFQESTIRNVVRDQHSALFLLNNSDF